jgi:DNA-binding NarL/FixJ family response regulator
MQHQLTPGEFTRRITVLLLTKNCLTFQAVTSVLKTCLRSKMRVLMVSSLEEHELRKVGSRTDTTISLLDAGMPPLPLAGCLVFLDRQLPGPRKILLGDFTCAEMCRFLSLGVNGFVPYSKVQRELRSAIYSVAKGHLYIPPFLLDEYVAYTRSTSTESSRRASRLTPRQMQVAALLQERLANKEISSVLQISENTVKFHLSKLFAKLGVHDRHSAVHLHAAIALDKTTIGESRAAEIVANHLGCDVRRDHVHSPD